MRILATLAALLAILPLAGACQSETLQPARLDPSDAAEPEDAGEEPGDGGLPPLDGGPARDAEPAVDAGGPAPDAGGPDAGAPPDGVEIMPIGPITLGPDGRSGTIPFTMPDDVVSFMVTAEGPLDAFFIVRTLSGPTGVLVSDDDSGLSDFERMFLGPFGAQFVSPNRVVPDRGAMAAQFPNNPNVSVTGGDYAMEIEGLEIQGQNAGPFVGMVDVTIFYRTAVPSRARIDISLHFTGAQNITASTAPTDPLVQDALEELANIYAQSDLLLGDIQYFDIDASYRTIAISLDGSQTQLEEMFRLSAGRGPGLHFFIVDRFEGGLGGMVAGVAGGVPGPPLNPGSVASGVAVSLAAAANDAAVLAHVMAHEGGHWLGLFHTSELIGSVDQFPETPEGNAASGFLMFPAVGGGTQIGVEQGKVIRTHIETIAE